MKGGWTSDRKKKGDDIWQRERKKKKKKKSKKKILIKKFKGKYVQEKLPSVLWGTCWEFKPFLFKYQGITHAPQAETQGSPGSWHLAAT